MVRMTREPSAQDARGQQGSSSIEQPTYWWYRARTDLLRAALGDYLGTPDRVLDVGSADGPSVGWMSGRQRFAIDLDPRGLRPGTGVCASALALPFADESFDVVGAFDVIEHCEPEGQAVDELARVLRPGGRLLASVPAYAWAWSDHDVRAGHYRRYTRPRIVRAVEAAGFEVLRASYGFTSVFPMFAAERVARRVRGAKPLESGGLMRLPVPVESALLRLSKVDAWLLRRQDLPFGSSVFVAAEKVGTHREVS